MRRALAIACALGLAAGAARAQEAVLTREMEDVWAIAQPVLARAPAAVRSLIEGQLVAWSALKYEDRRRVEDWLDTLQRLDAEQIASLFTTLAATPAEKQSEEVIRTLTDASKKGTVPLSPQRRIVIVAVGAGEGPIVNALMRGLAGDTAQSPTPRLSTEIRPFGAVIPKFKADISVPEAFLAMLLTGRGDPQNVVLQPQGQPREMASPTMGELYRAATPQAPARSAWVLYRDVNMLCDHSRTRGWGEKFSVTPVWGGRLGRPESALRDAVTDLRKREETSLDFPLFLADTSAQKLGFDTMYGEAMVRDLMQRVATGASVATDSDLFLARTAAEVLRSPAVDARLVVVRLGRPPAADNLAKPVVDAFVRDTDALVHLIWRAAREAAGWGSRTYFWLVIEGGEGAFVAGPDIQPGRVVKGGHALPQILPTVARMLGRDPGEFAGGVDGVSKKPIEELFEKE